MKNTHKMKWGLILSVAMIFMITSVGLAASIAIDTFDSGFVNLSVWNQDGFRTGTSSITDAAAIGGQRDVQLDYVSGTLISSLRIDFGDNNMMSFSQDGGNKSFITLQYDGSDASMILDYTGLNNYDLTDNLTNDSFVFRVKDNDLPMDITIQVYTDASNWSETKFRTPGFITGDVVDIVIPFSRLTQGAGIVNFQTVGAIQIIIDGTVNEGSDLNLDFFEADSVRDFGDLPEDATNYVGLTTLPTGARHVPNGLRLGPDLDAHLDTESNGFPNARAGMDQMTYPGGDDGIGANDEDGITRDMADSWVPGGTVGLEVEVNGCASTCYLNGWIDWDGNGTFEVADQVFTDQPVTIGVNTLTVSIPNSGYGLGDPVFSRFRLCSSAGSLPNGCNSTSGESFSGEVEDYWWDFGPTAVELTNLKADSNSSLIIAVAGVLLLMVSGGALLAYKRSRG